MPLVVYCKRVNYPCSDAHLLGLGLGRPTARRVGRLARIKQQRRGEQQDEGKVILGKVPSACFARLAQFTNTKVLVRAGTKRALLFFGRACKAWKCFARRVMAYVRCCAFIIEQIDHCQPPLK